MEDKKIKEIIKSKKIVDYFILTVSILLKVLRFIGILFLITLISFVLLWSFSEDNGKMPKEIESAHHQLTECEPVCPVSLNCSEWNQCVFHYPVACKGMELVCTKDNEMIPAAAILTIASYRRLIAFLMEEYEKPMDFEFGISACTFFLIFISMVVCFTVVVKAFKDSQNNLYFQLLMKNNQFRFALENSVLLSKQERAEIFIRALAIATKEIKVKEANAVVVCFVKDGEEIV